MLVDEAQDFNTLQHFILMLYVMCTRALHHLYFVCAGEFTQALAPYADCYDECGLEGLMGGGGPPTP